MLANFCLVAKNGRRILDNNGSYFFIAHNLFFTRKEMVAFLLMVAKNWSQKNFSSHGLGRKQIFVAQKWSHATIFWVCDQKKNLWGRSVQLILIIIVKRIGFSSRCFLRTPKKFLEKHITKMLTFAR